MYINVITLFLSLRRSLKKIKYKKTFIIFPLPIPSTPRDRRLYKQVKYQGAQQRISRIAQVKQVNNLHYGGCSEGKSSLTRCVYMSMIQKTSKGAGKLIGVKFKASITTNLPTRTSSRNQQVQKEIKGFTFNSPLQRNAWNG